MQKASKRGVSLEIISYISRMELKKILGTVLTALGTGGLIYAGITYANENIALKELLTYGVLSLIFFFSGLGLIRSPR